MAEGFAVAMNWGNSQGAKGPSCFVISHDGREGASDKNARQSARPEPEDRVVGGCGVDAGEKISIESTSNWLRPINLHAKRAGERSAGNLHAPFDVAGDGNQLRFGP